MHQVRQRRAGYVLTDYVTIDEVGVSNDRRCRILLIVETLNADTVVTVIANQVVIDIVIMGPFAQADTFVIITQAGRAGDVGPDVVENHMVHPDIAAPRGSPDSHTFGIVTRAQTAVDPVLSSKPPGGILDSYAAIKGCLIATVALINHAGDVGSDETTVYDIGVRAWFGHAAFDSDTVHFEIADTNAFDNIIVRYHPKPVSGTAVGAVNLDHQYRRRRRVATGG